jgi:hypothetical protein
MDFAIRVARSVGDLIADDLRGELVEQRPGKFHTAIVDNNIDWNVQNVAACNEALADIRASIGYPCSLIATWLCNCSRCSQQ